MQMSGKKNPQKTIKCHAFLWNLCITVKSHECHGVSNHWWHDCMLLTICSGHFQKKTSKLYITVLFDGNPWVTGGFPSQRANNTDCFPAVTSTCKLRIYILFKGRVNIHIRSQWQIVVENIQISQICGRWQIEVGIGLIPTGCDMKFVSVIMSYTNKLKYDFKIE